VKRSFSEEKKNGRAVRDIQAYYAYEKDLRTRGDTMSEQDAKQLRKDLKRFFKKKKTLPKRIIDAFRIIFDSTMDNPDFIRTTDTNPEATNAISNLIDLEKRVDTKTARYFQGLSDNAKYDEKIKGFPTGAATRTVKRDRHITLIRFRVLPPHF